MTVRGREKKSNGGRERRERDRDRDRSLGWAKQTQGAWNFLQVSLVDGTGLSNWIIAVFSGALASS